ncbi:MAG: hypothetical protein FWG70_12015 [Oscillospiraceae bacterium]|nr:hypothetical protein [Oscillospiraceae bacterium]
MQAYEGYLENGRVFTTEPFEVLTNIIGRRKVIITILDEPKEIVDNLSDAGKRQLLKNLCGSINDPTFVVPLEISPKYDTPIEDVNLR